MTARLPRNLRSDARDNRGRILEAVRSLFVTDGLDAPIRQIARRAEVGPATVYRHFPTKELLVAEASRRFAALMIRAFEASPVSQPPLAEKCMKSLSER